MNIGYSIGELKQVVGVVRHIQGGRLVITHVNVARKAVGRR